ncbi:MAG: 2Fe-2S iron-sulfur cluster binding domain-containing protein, partial [Desulfobacterales bacterium]|nr:2Fe-2S iron-sulfur cluster binding domain-containing protein [Desulfobacterales bacterium]
ARSIQLVYGSRSEEDIVFGEELTRLAGRNDNIASTFVISEPAPGYDGPEGFITGDLLKSLLGDVSSKMFYICGPEAMYAFCLPELEKLGVPRRRIRREIFGLPSDITAQPGWPAGVSGRDLFEVAIKGREKIKARAVEPLMASLERAGVVIPAVCRSGECGLCRTKLLSGRVFQPEGVKLRSSDRRFGWIHPCAAYPLENLEIMISS